MSTADDNQGRQTFIDLSTTVQPDELIRLRPKEDPYGLNQLDSLMPYNNGEDITHLLSVEEALHPMTASQWEMNGRIDTAIANHIASYQNSNENPPSPSRSPRDSLFSPLNSPLSSLPSFSLESDFDFDLNFDSIPDPANEQRHDTSIPQASTAQPEDRIQQPRTAQPNRFHQDYEHRLRRNAYEMAHGPQCICQAFPWDEDEPMDIKPESPSKEAKRRIVEAAFSEYRFEITRERRRVENYGRLF